MRIAGSLVLVIAIAAPASGAALRDRGGAASLCVGRQPGCYGSIQAAIDAAPDGATITVGPGTFAGGITIAKSLTLRGAAAAATVISGGSPVLTIGVADAATEPVVTLRGVTITGGVAMTNPTDPVPQRDFGGGILIPWAADGATGATVTISDSVVTGNRATPTTTTPSGVECPNGPCPFARGDGGGIGNYGNLTLIRTTLSHNLAGGAVASDAHGGGIWSAGVGTLTLENSAVTGNESAVAIPNGRFAIGGGVHIQDRGGLTIDNSVIDDNTAVISSIFPTGVNMLTNGGGIHVGDGSSVTIDNTRIDRNAVVLDTPNADAAGFDAGMIVGASALILRSSTVSDNRVVANVGSSADSGLSGSALEFDGTATISNTQITGNTATVTSQAGTAATAGAVAAFAPEAALISNSVISGNVQSASSATGTATVQGNGIVNNGVLELRNDQINDNAGTATGPTGLAQGGGIWNGLLFNPPSVLTLVNTVVTRNTLSASAGLTVQGGGLFTEFPVTLDKSRIEKITPDDCFGC
jgi:hypothetical protein